jgi:oxaloacetate decarboxylase gamma subunit
MSGIENITANNGIGIALTGMTIVFIALVLISGYIALLPKVLKKLSRFFPEDELPVARSEDPDFAEELRMAVVVAAALKKRRDIVQQLAGSGEGL